MKSIRTAAAVACWALAFAACANDFSVFGQSPGDDGGAQSDGTLPEPDSGEGGGTKDGSVQDGTVADG